MLLLADKWKEYELIDLGGGEKLERWGDYVLRRPDPQVIWPIEREWSLWKNPHGHYHRSNRGGGSWEVKKKYPDQWTINYGPLKFKIKPTGFKHTGLFPEQAANWDWMIDKIRTAKRPIKVLNLFAYTGGASVACAYAGAEVCHVDAAKGMVNWAKENIDLSGLKDRTVRFIVDDVGILVDDGFHGARSRIDLGKREVGTAGDGEEHTARPGDGGFEEIGVDGLGRGFDGAVLARAEADAHHGRARILHDRADVGEVKDDEEEDDEDGQEIYDENEGM